MTTQFVVHSSDEKRRPAYYAGWWQTYGEPFWSRTLGDAKIMSRSNANRVRRRLEDPNIWGGSNGTVYTVVAVEYACRFL